jgi:hypothetical protein
MEVKSGEGTVVVADRNRYSDECCNKDQEIARLNRVVDAQRDQNIINSVVQALGNKTA